MAEAKVGVIIEAQDQASASLNAVASALGGLKGKSQDLKTAVNDFAIASAAAFAAVSYAIEQSVTAAAEAEQIQAQLGAVLKSTGDVAGVTSEQAIGLSKSLEGMTQFSDEAVLSAQNILLTFTNINKNIFPETTKLVLDVSTALGQDLQSSAIQIGKALQDPIAGLTALKRVGVNFTDSQKEMIKTLVDSGQSMKAQQVILDELSKEFGGSAQANAKTFTGAMDQLGNKFNDLEESIGKAFLPILEDLIHAVAPIIDAVTKWAEDNPRLVQTLAEVALGITAVIALLAAGTAAFIAMDTAVGALVISLGLLVAPFALIAIAVGVVAGAIAQNWASSIDDSIKKNQEYTTQLNELQAHMNSLKAPIEEDTAKMAEFATKMADVTKKITDLNNKITDTLQSHNDTQADLNQQLGDAYVAQTQNIADIQTQINDKKNEIAKIQLRVHTQDELDAANADLQVLETKHTQEQAGLDHMVQVNKDIVAQISEAKRRAAETDYERKVEDILKQQIADDKAYLKKLQGFLVEQKDLKQQQDDLLKIEQQYTAGIAAENAKRLADYTTTFNAIDSLIKAHSGVTGGSTGGFSFGSGFSNSGSTTPTAIHDAIITPEGTFTTDPDDYIIATKTPESLGGGKNINITINGAVLTRDAAKTMGDLIIEELRLQLRV